MSEEPQVSARKAPRNDTMYQAHELLRLLGYDPNDARSLTIDAHGVEVTAYVRYAPGPDGAPGSLVARGGEPVTRTYMHYWDWNEKNEK